MKALGLSFGRKNRNSDIMVKQVLKQLKARGFEVEFINLNELNIQYCTGCTGCVVNLMQGGNGACVLKDDFHIVDEAFKEADAIIACAPVFALAPNGLYKTFVDRMGPSHDISFLTNARKQGEEMGKPEDKLPDKRWFKPRAAALMVVGGASTQNWVSFGLPSMYELFSNGMSIVDAYSAHGAMEFEHMVGNEKLMARLTEMGNHLADALETEGGLDKWYGDDEGVCPVCHNDLLTILHSGATVECPVCGISGELKIEDGQIKVDWPAEQIARSRLKYPGKLEHYLEIRNSAMTMKKIPDLKEKLAAYKEI